MKKRGFLLVVATLLMVASTSLVYGEERGNNTDKEVVEMTSDTLQETITLADVLKDLKDRGIITPEMENEYLEKIEKAVTEREKAELASEIVRLEDKMTRPNNELETKKEEISKKIQLLVDNKELQPEFGKEFIKRVDNSANSEEVDIVLAEVEKQVQLNKELGQWAWTEHYINTKLAIENYMKIGKLTQEQGIAFLERLEKTTDASEIFTIQKEINEQIEGNQTYAESFNKKFEEIKSEIKQLVSEGRISKEEGDKLISRLEEITTIEELDKLQLEVDAHQNKAIDPVKKEGDDPKLRKLPQTGEQVNKLMTILGVIVLGGLVVFLILKKRNK